uniref:lysozyme n=1 Tax=Timema tahoe TaxID=61484 RepID=A0A7R9NWF0_9NEOP|nr:unnamed protein product [Timema tahoe]
MVRPRPRTPWARSREPSTPLVCQRHHSSAIKLTAPQSLTNFRATTTSKLVTWAFGPALCTTYNRSSRTGAYQSSCRRSMQAAATSGMGPNPSTGVEERGLEILKVGSVRFDTRIREIRRGSNEQAVHQKQRLPVTMELPRSTLLLLCTLARSLVLGQQEDKVVDDLCLGCLCEAMSDCNRTFSCVGDDCGLFMITKPYWEDAGRHVIAKDNSSSPGAFQRCVVDPFCAAATVESYMKTYSKDCNENGAVDCEDFFALHFLGAGCEGDINQASPEGLDKLRVCQEEVAKIRSGN